MSSGPPGPSNRDPLQKLLDESEKELHRRLEEACEAEAKGLASESTAEIRQLEDNLLAAALAAKQTAALRDQMKHGGPVEREQSTSDVGAERDTPVVTGVREFTDDEGRSWRAWSVVPGLSRASATGGHFLGGFQNGWICFEGLDVSARRRLPYPRAKWPDTSNDELRQLLRQAIDAPLRERKAPGAPLAKPD